MSDQLYFAVKFAMAGLARCGVDTDLLLKRLKQGEFRQQTSPISTRLWCEMLDEAAVQTSDVDIGLKANVRADFADYGSLGFASLNAINLGQALEAFIQFCHLAQSGLLITNVVEAGLCRLEITFTDLHLPIHRTSIDWMLGFSVEFIRAWCGPNWRPNKVKVRYKKPNLVKSHEAAFNCPIEFSATVNCLLFDASILGRSRPDADSRLFDILNLELTRQLSETLKTSHADLPVVALVQKEIARLIGQTLPSIADVARALNISTRTLQRRLADADLDFKSLLEMTRRQMAENFLVHSDLALVEISFLLGYGEVSSFGRAFRRWTNLSPAEYRKKKA